jgi:hypothetical protein
MKQDNLTEFKRRARQGIIKGKLKTERSLHDTMQSTNSHIFSPEKPTEQSVREGFCDYLESLCLRTS